MLRASEENWSVLADDAVLERLRAQLEEAKNSDPEAVLGLEKGADAKAVRASFLAATKLYHPHRFARRERQVGTVANELFILISRAYSILSGKRKKTTSTMAVAASAKKTVPAPNTVSARKAEETGAPPEQEGRPSAEAIAAPAGRGNRRKADAAATVAPPIASGTHSVPKADGFVAHPRILRRDSSGVVPNSPEGSESAISQLQDETEFGGPSDPEMTVKMNLQSIAGPGAGRPSRPQPVAKPKVKEAKPPSQAEADKLFRDAVASLRVSNPGDAKKMLLRLVRAEPRKRKYRIYYHLAAGKLHESKNETKEALAEFDKALGLAPDFAPALKAADALRKSGKK